MLLDYILHGIICGGKLFIRILKLVTVLLEQLKLLQERHHLIVVLLAQCDFFVTMALLLFALFQESIVVVKIDRI